MKVKQWTINIALVIAGVCLLLSLAYFANGSLEMFPTEEQQGKARIAAVTLTTAFSTIEIALIRIKMKLKKQ